MPIDQQEAIQRLYAAGECCGGYFGNARGHGKIGVIMNAGRIAGKEVVTEAADRCQAHGLAVKTNHASAVHGHSVRLSGVMSGVEGVPTGAQVNLQVRMPGTTRYATVVRAHDDGRRSHREQVLQARQEGHLLLPHAVRWYPVLRAVHLEEHQVVSK